MNGAFHADVCSHCHHVDPAVIASPRWTLADALWRTDDRAAMPMEMRRPLWNETNDPYVQLHYLELADAGLASLARARESHGDPDIT